MNAKWQQALKAAFPGEAARYFPPMSIGNSAASADEGAALILSGIKTTTSSAFWDYADGRIPFAGALSVLLDGQGEARAIVETVRIEIVAFGRVEEDFARNYGEGDRSLAWWRSEMGKWYRKQADRHAERFSEDTPIVCEWFKVVRRL
jgi:uncharacterized protein YhfF